MERPIHIPARADIRQSETLRCRLYQQVVTITMVDFERLCKLAAEAEHTNRATSEPVLTGEAVYLE